MSLNKSYTNSLVVLCKHDLPFSHWLWWLHDHSNFINTIITQISNTDQAEVRKFLPFIHQIEENLGKNHHNYDSKEVFNPDKLTVPLSVFTWMQTTICQTLPLQLDTYQMWHASIWAGYPQCPFIGLGHAYLSPQNQDTNRTP